MHLIRLSAVNDLDDPADATPVGYLGSTPGHVVTQDEATARKFAGPADAYDFLESHPIPDGSLLMPSVVPYSGRDEATIRVLHD